MSSNISPAIDRTTPPPTTDIGEFVLLPVKTHKLDNGIPVYTVDGSMQDVVKVELIFMNPEFNQGQPLLHSSVNRLLSEGTSQHTAQQLAEMIDYFGSFYETEQTTDYCSVMLHTLNKHLESTLPIVHEIITGAIFPEKELLVFKQNNKQRLTVENEKVASVARRKFSEIIFGASHKYGYFVAPDDYDRITRESLQSFHRAHYVSNHCTIIVSGKVNEHTIQLLNKIFGRADWAKGNGAADAVSVFQPSPQKMNYIEKENAVQSAIRIGKPMFTKTHPDYAGMQVLNTILGGYFGSRLMANIREDKGYTYGIGSAVASMMQGGYFFVASEVGTDVCTKAIDEIYKEIELLKHELVANDELQMVKNYMLGSFLKGIDGAFNIADRWKGLLFYNLGFEYYESFVNTVKTISPEEIMHLADKYFARDSFYELVVGKKM